MSPTSSRAFEAGAEPFSLGGGELFRIVDTAGHALGRENHCRRDDRAGERSAAGFVDAGDRPDAKLFVFHAGH